MRFQFSDAALGAMRRLGCLIPLTPWPVMLTLELQETYTVGRHTAMAMHAVGTLANELCLAVAVIGALLTTIGARDAPTRLWLLVLGVVNYFLLCSFIDRTAAVFV